MFNERCSSKVEKLFLVFCIEIVCLVKNPGFLNCYIIVHQGACSNVICYFCFVGKASPEHYSRRTLLCYVPLDLPYFSSPQSTTFYTKYFLNYTNSTHRGLIFGLSEEQSKGAISHVCRSLLLKAGNFNSNLFVMLTTMILPFSFKQKQEGMEKLL